MKQETFGLIILMILATGSLLIGLKIQEFDFVLGYIVGIFGMLTSVGIGLNIMTWGK